MTTHRLSPAAGVLAATVLLSVVACSNSSPQASSGPGGSSSNPAGGTTSPAPTTHQKSHSSAGPTTPTSPAPATEFNPPGDIPDNQVFVDYRPPGSPVTIQVPEGWARSTHSGTVTFTDHYNSVGIAVRTPSTGPSVQSARRQDVPSIERVNNNVHAVQVSTVARSGQQAVLITYQADSQPDPVTNKVVVDAIERYEFFRHGHEVILTLTGPSGADNVDPWRTVSESLRWS